MAFDHVEWERLVKTQMSISVRDPDGHRIGMEAAVRSNGWKPVDGRKHTLVGVLDRYEFYNPDDSGDEADLCILIAPDPSFMGILDDVARRMSLKERRQLQLRSRGPSGHVVEAEVTPDADYYDNAWFRTDDTSQLIGHQIAVYGPWVRDMGHAGRPEIHPCEAIWWRDDLADATGKRIVIWRLILLQDDSNRFDRVTDFEAGIARAWSAFPRRAEITLALAAPWRKSSSFAVGIERSRQLRPVDNQTDVHEQQTADTKVRVSKSASAKRHIKSHLSELVPPFAGPAIYRCFLTMEVEFGTGDRGDEGFVELIISHIVP